MLVMPSTQYLQVPKPLPRRARSGSRSKSRPREAVSIEEVVVPALKAQQWRLQSPPIPAVEFHIKTPPPSRQDGYFSLTEHKTTPYTPSIPRIHHPAPEVEVTSPTPSINFADLNGEMYTLETCSTPPPPEPLRQKIIGAWKLESYVAYPTPESPIQRPTYPMTKNVTGFIMYTPDGYMSAQMLIPGQKSFKRGEGEEPQWAEAGKRFFAYCGPYYISDEGTGREETLRHTFQVCNLPGWIGDVQVRTHHFEEDGEVLVLGSEEPTEIKGDKRVPVLKWRRARDNTNAAPPAPMPQIKISGPGEP
ncbi:hypothetical protein B0A51_05453 [Rachicladosporium sp. CCFEE 5018]|nr:hypothetical protein B0A51_05453 [Rachicladosporium sp. CCFEE 5018]OQO30624.1 hypothetical protein B0A51_03564 [Rachicladosporium sp. CCFEE 5018]